jgi:hypothetical protein
MPQIKTPAIAGVYLLSNKIKRNLKMLIHSKPKFPLQGDRGL